MDAIVLGPIPDREWFPYSVWATDGLPAESAT